MINALAESINALYKAEVIHRRGRWRTTEEVEFATLDWVDWFNHRRLLEPIGDIPPAEKPRQTSAPHWNSPQWPHNVNQIATGNPGGSDCMLFRSYCVPDVGS
jgi:hypothetical protein